MWTKLQEQCSRRSEAIKRFNEELESVERVRSDAVGGELRQLVDDMVAIGYRMSNEVERVAEVM